MAPQAGPSSNLSISAAVTDREQNARGSSFYSPKYGNSPLRIETRAEAASKRSIEAIRRVKIPTDGIKAAVVELDIGIPFKKHCSVGR